MRKTAFLIAVLLLGLSGISWSEDYDSALQAYKEGDYLVALAAYEALAANGDANAQNDLGVMYSLGEGVPRNALKAMKWYRLAAEQGHADAQVSLGWMFVYGYGESPCSEGVNPLALTADQGGALSPAAARGISRSRATMQEMSSIENRVEEKGEPQGCVPQNYELAFMWLDIAAEGGVENAVSGRDIVIRKMTPEQIASGRKLSKICREMEYKGCY